MATKAEVKPPAKVPDTAQDDSLLGGLAQIGRAMGEMFLIEDTPEAANTDVEAPIKEVKAVKGEAINGHGNASTINLNLGDFFKPERPVAASKKKGKAAGEQEPTEGDNESDE